MGRLNLGGALELALLIADEDPDRWPRAAVRWHARFVQEAKGIGLEEAELALAAVRALPGPHADVAAQTLRRVAEVMASVQLSRRLGVAGADA
jgi:hypothetical protein